MVKSARILSCAERGTGLDQGEGEVLPGGPRDHGAGLVALSSLALSISAWLKGVPAGHRTGFKTASKMRLFQGQESHSTGRAAYGPLTARELGSRKVWFGLPHYVDVAIWRRASVAVGTLVLLARHSAWSERLRPCHW